MPAVAAFWMISKLARPDTIRIPSDSGSRPSSSCAPISLSTALCRPTSSRDRDQRPSGVEQPRRVQAAGAFEHGLCRAQRSGSAVGPRPARSAGRRRSARTAPRSPPAMPCRTRRSWTWRRSCAAANSSTRADRNRDHVVVLLLARDGAVARPCARRRGSRSSPRSEGSPTASSKSCPGVRIVTATFRCSVPGSSTRISIGSSVASRSLRRVRRSPSTVTTCARVVLAGRGRMSSAGRGGGGVRAHRCPQLQA